MQPMGFTAWLPALLVVGLLGAAGSIVAVPRVQALRRARLRQQPLRADWQRILQARVPLAARLPAALRARLHGQVQVFLAEKTFVGCQGQAVDDTVRLTIAAQACLLLLGRAEEDCFPRLRQVLVYPGPFVVPRRDWLPGGVMAERPEARAGESWAEGRVVLAWSEVLAGADDPDDGRNVVLHEFAHQVDQDGGPADGRPWRADAGSLRRFAAAMAAARAEARAAAETAAAAAAAPGGAPAAALFDAHALGDEAEFFAAATEAFFEAPQRLDAQSPALADELARLYGVDPRRW